MAYNKKQKEALKKLPKVDLLASQLQSEIPKAVRMEAARDTIAELRQKILESQEPDLDLLSDQAVKQTLKKCLEERIMPSLRPLVNATGVVIHTNLGRSPLPEEIFKHMFQVAVGYSNLEYDLAAGRRGSRYSHVEGILCELTGAESALVVNNNAAAVLITLETMAKGREVIVSRGELVEIGGSFRIPDVMARSGAVLREVGATNRTHLKDYANAINDNTAMLMKVHQSNFQVVGFTKSVSIEELAELGRKHGLPVYEDLGSGNLTDFSRYGLFHEPTVQESLKAGANLVSFSGDKLLGGPQAGIILGKKELVDPIKKNPINRAVRIDKLTLAALEHLLRIYRDPESAVKAIPTLNMITTPYAELKRKASRLLKRLKARNLECLELGLADTISRVGGGALPLQDLKSRAVTIAPKIKGVSAARLEEWLRNYSIPVIVRLEEGSAIMDVRTLFQRDFRVIEEALTAFCKKFQ